MLRIFPFQSAITVCPELLDGLSTPREAAEIDVTDLHIKGASVL